MKRYFVIYNPTSGNEMAGQKMFHVAETVLELEDVEFTFYATKRRNDGELAAIRGCMEGYDMIISCGGDGTVHEIVNGIMKSPAERKPKLAIMPAGTINDFAAQLKMPRAYANFASLIMKNSFKEIDVGKINDDYFVNVVGGGAFMNIPHDVTIEEKTILGKYAYYFKAAFEVPGQLLNTHDITYIIDGVEYNYNTLLFLVINSSGAGGFKNLCPKAKINDGILDVVIFEKAGNADLLQIFTRVFNGQHISHPKVHYCQGKDIEIRCDGNLPIDTDGDMWGNMPVKISSVNKAIEILVP